MEGIWWDVGSFPVLAFLAVALAVAVSAVTYRAFAGVRARRRATWELDRALWRLWITRP